MGVGSGWQRSPSPPTILQSVKMNLSWPAGFVACNPGEACSFSEASVQPLRAGLAARSGKIYQFRWPPIGLFLIHVRSRGFGIVLDSMGMPHIHHNVRSGRDREAVCVFKKNICEFCTGIAQGRFEGRSIRRSIYPCLLQSDFDAAERVYQKPLTYTLQILVALYIMQSIRPTSGRADHDGKCDGSLRS